MMCGVSLARGIQIELASIGASRWASVTSRGAMMYRY